MPDVPPKLGMYELLEKALETVCVWGLQEALKLGKTLIFTIYNRQNILYYFILHYIES